MTSRVLKVKLKDAELIARCIERSGLTIQSYAEDVLLRERRTVDRWRSGESPIPRVVRRFLDQQPH